MVVERKIIRRDDAGAEIPLTRPGLASQIRGGGKEGVIAGARDGETKDFRHAPGKDRRVAQPEGD